MQDSPKAVWSIPYVSVTFLPSLKQNCIAYPSSKVSWRPDCIFEIDQLWQSGFCRVYSNCCCSCLFEAEIIKIGQSSHKMYSNKILSYQESTTILNAYRKKVWKLIVCTSYIFFHWSFVPPTIRKLNCYREFTKGDTSSPCLRRAYISQYTCVGGRVRFWAPANFKLSVTKTKNVKVK